MASKKDKNDYKRPSVYFSTEDETLLKHALDQNESFAAYVRRLIREDMEKSETDRKMKKVFKEALQEFFNENGGITIAQTIEEAEEIGEVLPDEMELLRQQFGLTLQI